MASQNQKSNAMKVRVISEKLNIRKRAAPTGTIYGVLKTDFEFEVESVVEGQSYARERKPPSKIWCKDKSGFYYWAGGLRLLEDGNISRKSWKDLLPGTEQRPAPNSLADIKVKLPWYIKEYGIDKIWKETVGEDVKIAIIDTGIVKEHDDLPVSNAINFYNVVKPNEEYQDNSCHGSWCASIAAGRGVSQVVGVAPMASLVVAKVINRPSDDVFERPIKEALKWAIEIEKADVVSMSLSFDEYPAVADYLENLDNLGSMPVIVAAIGNDSNAKEGSTLFPANHAKVISVGAVDRNGERIAISNVDSIGEAVFAPGQGLGLPAFVNDCTEPVEGGTSFATPFIAGVVALGISIARKNKLVPKRENIQRALIDTSTVHKLKNSAEKYRVVNVHKFCKKMKSK